MIYESKPFTIESGADIDIGLIEVENELDFKAKETYFTLLKENKPAASFIVKVYKQTTDNDKLFIGFTITDSFGNFILPISEGNEEYIFEVYSMQQEKEGIDLVIKKR